ncbi:iron-sulfur cluster assembly protein [Aeropyrum camini]|uniref:Predicted metal-sulfur cluster biosynthetic enzyme n=1 Tax=Aeropyrum camini SY1 = JCM 12091 TaxID=1198449 RepID=U3TE55_9CREN|nr:iron-sulfur cluster assembly protein [Aeropyrum camini]BAN90711.1 predicted metal-sulfur cluster biosynthetic enzyme [Aeropyrum camini SY1 = JCM 12091]
MSAEEGGGQPRIVLEGPKELLDRIVEALKEVYDPEIPVNVYDLGLIYEVRVEGPRERPRIKVKMSLTAIGCPVSVALPAYVEDAIREAVPEAEDVEVEVVFDPPWTPERVTPEGRELLKTIYGYDIVEQWKRAAQQQY